MQLSTLVTHRLFSILIFLIFIHNIFTAQVKIHEKIEIAPKSKISYQINSSSNEDTTIPLLFEESFFHYINTTRPCQINASGYIDYVWGSNGTSYALWYISGYGWKNDWAEHTFYLIWNTTITDTPVSFELGEGNPISVNLFHNNILPSGFSRTFGPGDTIRSHLINNF